jgi:molybdopterin/thiamine biosynthesis adenylyltransferase
MSTSTAWSPDPDIVTIQAEPIPRRHVLEDDTYERQKAITGHNQTALAKARLILVGAGGLNSWGSLALLRTGATDLVIIDPDRVERTNTSRQLYFGADLNQPKAARLPTNLAPHAVEGARITGIAAPAEDVLEAVPDLPADLLIVGVDNNACRFACARWARKRGIPAIFTMLSFDGMRCHCFLQGPRGDDPCLWCAIPDLDEDAPPNPCVASIITACFLASAFTIFFAHRALMGWDNIKAFNWREADLTGRVPDRIGTVTQRSNCRLCHD